jgi:hypothetical protein
LLDPSPDEIDGVQYMTGGDYAQDQEILRLLGRRQREPRH